MYWCALDRAGCENSTAQWLLRGLHYSWVIPAGPTQPFRTPAVDNQTPVLVPPL